MVDDGWWSSIAAEQQETGIVSTTSGYVYGVYLLAGIPEHLKDRWTTGGVRTLVNKLIACRRNKKEQTYQHFFNAHVETTHAQKRQQKPTTSFNLQFWRAFVSLLLWSMSNNQRNIWILVDGAIASRSQHAFDLHIHWLPWSSYIFPFPCVSPLLNPEDVDSIARTIPSKGFCFHTVQVCWCWSLSSREARPLKRPQVT